MSNPSVTVGPYVVGEKPQPLVYTYVSTDTGLPIDISAWTAKYSYREEDSATSTLANATVVNGPGGQVSYTWTGAEFPTSGHYLTEFWVGNSTNRFASILIEFDVRQPVGAVPAI